MLETERPSVFGSVVEAGTGIVYAADCVVGQISHGPVNARCVLLARSVPKCFVLSSGVASNVGRP